jgi:hypothetical protein
LFLRLPHEINYLVQTLKKCLFIHIYNLYRFILFFKPYFSSPSGFLRGRF